MGLKDPIGKTVEFWGMKKQIVGVVKDFNFESLYQTIKPCFFRMFPVMPNFIVKIKAGTEKQTIGQIQKTYETFYKGLAFEYKFLDKEYQALCLQKTVLLFCPNILRALLYSSPAWDYHSAFTAQKRQKEIGIRKAIGASVKDISAMLSKDFLRLVLTAMCIAFPVSWLSMHNWLQRFAYRIHIGAGVFLVAGLSIILITVLSISFQAIGAALANPVNSLRSGWIKWENT